MAAKKRKPRRKVAAVKRARRYAVTCYSATGSTVVARLPLAKAKSLAAKLGAKHKANVYEVV